MLMRNCYLLGFMGAGKSYVARRLATRMSLPAFDLDLLIEAKEGRSIATIFEVEGEAYFRTVEAQLLRQTSQQTPSIIALGGGTPIFQDNMNWIKEAGYSIFLDPPITVLLERLQHARTQRPLLANLTDEAFEKEVARRLDARRPIYEQAGLQLEETDINRLLNRCVEFINA